MENENVKEESAVEAAKGKRKDGSPSSVDDAVRAKAAEAKEKLLLKLGQPVFYRRKESGEIVPALVVACHKNGTYAIVWFSETTLGKSAGEKSVSVGMKKNEICPDLEALQIHIEMEKAK